MTNCVYHDVPLRDCPTIQSSPALKEMVTLKNHGYGGVVRAPWQDWPELSKTNPRDKE